MIASRLLGLGKEKFKVPDDAYYDLSDEELDELTSSQMDDFNPTDHDLAATVRRYLGIKMDKATTKLGGSDWGRSDISTEQFEYMLEDVSYLPALWEALKPELKEARLDQVFRRADGVLPSFESDQDDRESDRPCLVRSRPQKRHRGEGGCS